MTVFFNGRFLDKEQVSISPDDRGFVFADGIYEVMRWYGGYFLAFEAHKKRLFRSMKEVRIEWLSGFELDDIAKELIRRNQLQKEDALFYLQVTRGSARRNHLFPSPQVTPTVYATATPYSSDPATGEVGIAVITQPDERWLRCDIKSIALLPNVLAKQKASEYGAQEAIFIRGGVVTEGAHSNVFCVKEGVVYTHPESGAILSGITRNLAVDICRELSIPLIEQAIPEASLNALDEVFISNTSGEIVPVVRVNGKPLSDGKPGTITRRLQLAFRKYTENAETGCL
jgi:D-alanine transaminase